MTGAILAFNIVFAWFLFALLVGVFANQRRNRSGFGWFLMAVLIGPLFAFLFVAIMRKKEIPDYIRVTQ